MPARPTGQSGPAGLLGAARAWRDHRTRERSGAAQWRGRCDLADGLEVAVAASASMEQGGVGQGEAERGSPVRSSDGEVATGGGAEEVVSVGWAPVTGNVCGELPELEGRRRKRTSTRPRRRNAKGRAHHEGENRRRRWPGRRRGAAEVRPLERTRGREGGEGCSWCASKGEWRRRKRGAAASGYALSKRHSGEQRKGRGGLGSASTWGQEKKGEGGRCGGQLGRPATAPGRWTWAPQLPCKQGSPGLTGGPRPQCWAAALVDRQAWAAQCRAAVQTVLNRFKNI
jgi:hypothetical protein